MAELNRIKARIRELAVRRKNVRLVEIQSIVNQLALAGFETRSKNNGHQTLFRVGSRRFGVCCHNPGSAQIKPCYVDEFLNAMAELGLYEED